MKLTAAPVRLVAVEKRFDRVVAVNRVSLEIEPGALVTLLGPSGCGKTTTLRLIAGLERPSAGRIFIDEEDVTPLPAHLRDISMVFQNYALFPHMNVFENVAYGLKVQGMSDAEVRRQVGEALELVGLTGLEQRAPGALSGGQQQRVALARALVLKPKVLLFDEPLSNLDAKLRKRVRQEIRELQQNLGITAVYVTHDQEEAMAISDRVVVMRAGRIEQIGTPHELYTQPANHFVADFIGSANFLEGTYDGHTVQIGDHRHPHRQAIPSGRVTVMVRPEAVRLHPEGAEGLEASVRAVAYLGQRTELLLATPAGLVEAVLPGDHSRRVRQGDRVRLTFDPAGVYLLEPREPAG